MHPSLDIVCTRGNELSGKKIVLCVTGSVAAVRSPEVARELMRHGAEVRAAMTPSAAKLITPELMHWATGNPVVTELTGKLEHVELASWADLILVAPATANTISKAACAVDDTPVTSIISVALGLEKKVIMVPAMHGSMYAHKLLQDNISRLKGIGVSILEPRVEEGKAKMLDVGEIADFVIGELMPKDMLGLKVLVTAGPTVEPIDPIKLITNRSSGKMGIAVAKAAARRGAEVTLIYGPGNEATPHGVKVIRVETTSEMKEAFENELRKGQDIIVSAAAAQDFMVESPHAAKLRHFEPVEIKLVPAPRVIENARRLAPHAYIIGFKAEYGVSDNELVEAARGKLEENRLDMVVANDVSRAGAGFAQETNEVVIVTPSITRKIASAKIEVANAILDEALRELRSK